MAGIFMAIRAHRKMTWVCVTVVLAFWRAGQAGQAARGQALVPGSGELIEYVGDDFEDPNWSYNFRNPKNSSELDGQKRLPDGSSKNGRLFEGPMRGHPDVLERIETPEGGLPDSQGALSMRSLFTGTPNRPSRKKQQDDLIVNVRARLGRLIPVGHEPNFVVRVFLPPFDEWEDRTGGHFGLRAGLHGNRSQGDGESEEYWPGMFVHFKSQTDRRNKQDSAYLRIRAGKGGQDFSGPAIEETGWWTFGMSCTPDGQVHYYASPGVDELNPEDHIASQFPYGFRARNFETFFFNVMSDDDGRHWSTTFVIDDPRLYVVKPLPSKGAVAKKSGGKKRRQR
jgi:hypothetical protein